MIEDEDDEITEETINYNRSRIIKGYEVRSLEERPVLFDIFYTNFELSDKLDHLPTVCPPYQLLESKNVSEFLNIQSVREIDEDEIRKTIGDIKYFLNIDESKYWYFTKVILTNFLEGRKDDSLLEIFSQQLQEMVSVPVDVLYANVKTIEKLKESDLAEHRDFYRQLHNHLEYFLARKWLDRYHENLLCETMKEKLPKHYPTDDIQLEEDKNVYTKTQRKYLRRIKLFEKEEEKKVLNSLAKKYFDLKFRSGREANIFRNTIQGVQFWGGEQFAFDDVINIEYQNMIGEYVLPNFNALVYMGIDWNPYNREKYTPENPPPKSVQGYYFTIYYPLLTSKSKAPNWQLCPELLKYCTDPADPSYKYTAIKFTAPDPYLPIVFRIVDKQWDVYRNNGIITNFENNEFSCQIVFKASLYYKGDLPELLY